MKNVINILIVFLCLYNISIYVDLNIRIGDDFLYISNISFENLSKLRDTVSQISKLFVLYSIIGVVFLINRKVRIFILSIEILVFIYYIILIISFFLSIKNDNAIPAMKYIVENLYMEMLILTLNSLLLFIKIMGDRSNLKNRGVNEK